MRTWNSPSNIALTLGVLALGSISCGCRQAKPPAAARMKRTEPPSTEFLVSHATEQLLAKEAEVNLQPRISFLDHAAPKFSVDSPIVIGYQLENHGTKPRLVMHQGFWPDHGVFVESSAGPVHRTQWGSEQHDLFESPSPPTEKVSSRLLEPGKVDDSWEPIDLTMLFLFSGPGRYQVHVQYRDRSGVDVISNVLTFELVR